MSLSFNNTFLRTYTPKELRGTDAGDMDFAFVLGKNTELDGGIRLWYFDLDGPNSMAVDDGTDNSPFFKPNLTLVTNPGRWSPMPGYFNNFILPPVAISKSGASSRPFSNSSAGSGTVTSNPFQVSATKWSLVVYTVSFSPSLSLTGGQTGQVSLVTSATIGGSYTAVGVNKGGLTGTLVVGLVINGANSGQIAAMIPPGYYGKLDIAGSTSGLSITLSAQDETIFG